MFSSKLINPRVMCIAADTTINGTLQKMIEGRVSSALIVDALDNIIGILTERDILRKISTLDLDMKLDRKVNTVMSRPVEFAYENSLEGDIKHIHATKKFRHFPVLKKGCAPQRKNLVGIITVTDIARAYLAT